MKFLDKWVGQLHKKKTAYYWGLFGSFLNKQGRILDVGCGSGVFTRSVIDKGYEVTAVDVVDKVKVEGVKPVIFDGKKLPFEDKSVDQVLFLAVLHHVEDFEGLLKEAGRVGRQVIVVEDVYENVWQRFWTQTWDSVLNKEFVGHPHNNRSDRQWRKIFKRLGFEVKKVKNGKLREIFYEFRQTAYLLQA